MEEIPFVPHRKRPGHLRGKRGDCSLGAVTTVSFWKDTIHARGTSSADCSFDTLLVYQLACWLASWLAYPLLSECARVRVHVNVFV